MTPYGRGPTKLPAALKRPWRRNKYLRLIKWLWVTFGLSLALFVGYVWAVSVNLLGLFGQMPSFRLLENPRNDLASEVYAADGVLLGKYFSENRSPVEFNQISPHVIHALLAAEDTRFERHSGVDFKGTLAIPLYLLIGERRGSSTISQQLAKNLYDIRQTENQGPVSGIVVDKTKEWLTAIKIERSYTKREIITMYLNTVYFGSYTYGIKAAARTFFRKEPYRLDPAEAALLVGMLNNPAHYSPVNHPERARWKRNGVLQKMLKHKYLTPDAYRQLAGLPLGLRFTPDNPNRGLATYLRGYLEGELLRWAKQNNFDLYTDGLRIRTTLDSRLQRHAERVVAAQMAAQQAKFEAHLGGQPPWTGVKDADYLGSVVVRSARYRALKAQYGDNQDSIWIMLRKRVPMRVFSWDGEKDTIMSPLDSIRYYKRFLHAGLLAMDPVSGEVKAWVGGINYKHFKYDHVRQGRRQPGSAFKPIVYAAAIANMGYTPCTEELDAPITIGGWTARNYSRAYSNEPVTLRQALGQSLNTVPARILQKLGVPAVLDYARRLGITGKLRAYPAICLGTEAVSVYDLLGAYGTFANGGVWNLPQYVTRIEDRYGNVLHQFTPRRHEAMNAEHAYLMTHLLQSGLGDRGSAQALAGYAMTRNNEVGAKTGTTQNYADGWCVVLTQELATAVWFGGDDMRVHFRDANGTGSRTALPIAGEFMDRAFADPAAGLKKGPFRKPRTLSVDLDCNRNPFLAARSDSTLYVPPPKNDSLVNAGFVEEF